MKFKYKKFWIPPAPAFPERKYLLRPIIPLLLTRKDKTIGYEALYGYGILGHYGFFNIFRVIFDLKKEQIELRPKK